MEKKYSARKGTGPVAAKPRLSVPNRDTNRNTRGGALGRRLIRFIDKFTLLNQQQDVTLIKVEDTLTSAPKNGARETVDWEKNKLISLCLFIGIIFIAFLIFISFALGANITKNSGYSVLQRFHIFYENLDNNSETTIEMTAALALYNPSYSMTNVFSVTMELLVHNSTHTPAICDGSVPPKHDLNNFKFTSIAIQHKHLHPIRNLYPKSSTVILFDMKFKVQFTDAQIKYCNTQGAILIFPKTCFIKGSTLVGDVIFMPSLGMPFNLDCKIKEKKNNIIKTKINITPDDLFHTNSYGRENFLPLTYA